jgi:hypothetical protein
VTPMIEETYRPIDERTRTPANRFVVGPRRRTAGHSVSHDRERAPRVRMPIHVGMTEIGQ